MQHPRELATTTEWEVVYPVAHEPLAIIRRLVFGGTVTFRAVTGAPASADRALIGYFPSLDDAAAAAWRRYVDAAAQQHEAAAHTHGGRERGDGRRTA